MRPLRRATHRWVNNIKMYLGEIRWGKGIDWVGLVDIRDKWSALVNVVMNLRVPQNGGKFSSGCTHLHKH
jgi:hypothetical protein